MSRAARASDRWHDGRPMLSHEIRFTAGQVELVGRLIGAGFPVLEFSAHDAGLEDLFIEITGGRVQ